MGCALPVDSGFNNINNPHNKAAIEALAKEFGTDGIWHLRRNLHKWIVSFDCLQDGDATYDATQRRRRHKVVDS